MRILFFAQLKDATNCDLVDLPVAAPLNSEQLWGALIERYPALTAHRASVRLACNLEYADPQRLFNPADEVALIPPVSGG
jgi:molybdopterin converting factor subunit 1